MLGRFVCTLILAMLALSGGYWILHAVDRMASAVIAHQQQGERE